MNRHMPDIQTGRCQPVQDKLIWWSLMEAADENQRSRLRTWLQIDLGRVTCKWQSLHCRRAKLELCYQAWKIYIYIEPFIWPFSLGSKICNSNKYVRPLYVVILPQCRHVIWHILYKFNLKFKLIYCPEYCMHNVWIWIWIWMVNEQNLFLTEMRSLGCKCWSKKCTAAFRHWWVAWPSTYPWRSQHLCGYVRLIL